MLNYLKKLLNNKCYDINMLRNEKEMMLRLNIVLWFKKKKRETNEQQMS